MEDIAEAMSQLAKIGTELLRPEEDRDPLWRTIPIAKEIMVSKGIAVRAPWESIQVHYNNTKSLTSTSRSQKEDIFLVSSKVYKRFSLSRRDTTRARELKNGYLNGPSKLDSFRSINQVTKGKKCNTTVHRTYILCHGLLDNA